MENKIKRAKVAEIKLSAIDSPYYSAYVSSWSKRFVLQNCNAAPHAALQKKNSK